MLTLSQCTARFAQEGVSALRRFRGRLAAYQGRRCFSQEGEDVLLMRLLSDTADGFYIDVGAHHPIRFSNTYNLYKRGWKGITIEPNRRAAWKFRLLRPRDTHLALAVSETREVRRCYTFHDPALDTLDPDRAKVILDSGKYRSTGSYSIQTERLDRIIERYVPTNRYESIDLLSVDVEGLDLVVLRSNNWQRFRPRFVLAEETHLSLDRLPTSELVQFMSRNGYLVFAKTYNTLFFRDTQ